jgi:hypothetical protein
MNDVVITQTNPAIRTGDTAEVYGNEAQIVLMRLMGRVVEEACVGVWNVETVARVAADMDTSGRGPIYFEVIKILYEHWRSRMTVWLDSGESGESGGSDGDGDAEMHVRNMGRQRVGGGYMRALLGRLERYGMVKLGDGGKNLHATMVAARTAREAQEVQ